MKTLIYFGLILTVSAATDVKVYVSRGDSPLGHKPARRDAFIFGYHFGDVLFMHLAIIRKNVDVFVEVYLQYPSGGVNVKERVWPMSGTIDSQFYEIERNLNITEIVIDVETESATGICTRKQIIRGNLISRQQAKYAPYDSSCIRRQPCNVDVYLSNHVNTTVKDLQSFNHTIYYVITVISSIAAAALVLVVIVAIRTRCWGRLETPAPRPPLHLPNDEPCGPFYVNMLFRDQCAQEIADIEKHLYEEIGERSNHQTTASSF